MEKIRRHIFIKGKVQGVNFRYYTKEKANLLDIFGWVKNLNDNRVEILVEGEKEKIEKLIDWLKQGGPYSAKIDDIKIEEQKYLSEFNIFEIKY